jgi:hypothetical protein
MKISNKKVNKSQYPDSEFKEYLNQLASPNYQGGSWILPEKPTFLEKSKHELCREILLYQRKRKITDEEMAKRMELTLAETQDILYYRIAYFTLDRLITYANKLFKNDSLMVGIIKSKELHGKNKAI